ncbi:uncharacterized protein CEXT_441481 [Caerostris extrusa]|uniref:Uncharacterized protein n=1 Tax=Caerostris extrusa TaxID=172846 RepID=A0AAV4XSG1_CAEEX|nr:uncharacterized protein CEXT_441481 [Caerostris extrusa]
MLLVLVSQSGEVCAPLAGAGDGFLLGEAQPPPELVLLLQYLGRDKNNPKKKITDHDKIPIKIGAILPATAFEQIRRQYDKALVDTANNINRGKFHRFGFSNVYRLEAQTHVMALAASPLNVLKTLCDQVFYPRNITAIMYMTNSPVYGSNAASAQYMLQLTGYLGLPVIAWNVDNVGLEQGLPVIKFLISVSNPLTTQCRVEDSFWVKSRKPVAYGYSGSTRLTSDKALISVSNPLTTQCRVEESF